MCRRSKSRGVDVELVNWRAVFAPPGIKDKDLATLSETVEKMVKSAGWQKVLKERNWLDLYQARDQFLVSLKEEGEATAAVLKELGLAK